MIEVENGNKITGDYTDQFGKTLERNICLKFVSVLIYLKHPELINSVATPHIQVLFSKK